MVKERTHEEQGEGLTEEELAAATGEPLPEREAMSVVPGVVIGGGAIPASDGADLIQIDDSGPTTQ